MEETPNPIKKKVTVAEIVQENAQIKADISTFITVVSDGFAELGISMEELGQGKDIMQIMGKVVPQLAMKMGTGGFKGDAFSKFNELVPILDRYKHLSQK